MGRRCFPLNYWQHTHSCWLLQKLLQMHIQWLNPFCNFCRYEVKRKKLSVKVAKPKEDAMAYSRKRSSDNSERHSSPSKKSKEEQEPFSPGKCYLRIYLLSCFNWLIIDFSFYGVGISNLCWRNRLFRNQMEAQCHKQVCNTYRQVVHPHWTPIIQNKIRAKKSSLNFFTFPHSFLFIQVIPNSIIHSFVI